MYNDNYYYQQQHEELSGIAAATLSYNEPIGQQQQQQQGNDWDTMELEEENEEAYYAQYDLDMANALAEADYQDCYYEQQQYNEQQYEEEEEYDEKEEDYHYQDQQDQKLSDYDIQNDSLLSLVVGVQSYLTEQADFSAVNKLDSPLYNLQYKMYTYMRQRAFELGVEF